jgi:hypothetical protein
MYGIGLYSETTTFAIQNPISSPREPHHAG